MNKPVRLQKYIADCGITSRRKAEHTSLKLCTHQLWKNLAISILQLMQSLEDLFFPGILITYRKWSTKTRNTSKR